jgi:hypothetical protein
MSKNVERLAKSLSEDLIYVVTNANMKTSKHINLGLAMKSLTNSRKIINILNKYGHCCSYTTLEELETEAIFAATLRLNICPEGIIPINNLSTGLAYNNFDRFVDTTTGKDTLHDTVGIIIQNIVDGPQTIPGTDVLAEDLDENEPSTSSKKRSRTFDVLTLDLQSYNKRSKIRQSLEPVDSPLRSFNVDIKQLRYSYIDLVWLVSHFLKIPNIPAWVGFNTLLKK